MKIGQTPVEQEWFKIHTRYGSCEVALNPSSRDFKELYRKKEAQFARYRQRHDGRYPEGAEDKIARECAAHAVLLDWRGMEGEDGKPLKFTPENAIAVFEDPVIGDPFLKGVMDAATKLWDSFAEEIEDAEKN